MKLLVLREDVTRFSADALVVNLFEGVETPGGATGAVDRALDGAIAQAIAQGEFRGKLEETLLIHTLGKLPSPRVIVVGLGEREGFDLDAVRRAAAAAARRAEAAGARTLATVVHGAGIGGLDPEEAARATVEGTLLGLYRYEELKSRKEGDGRVEEVFLLERNADKIPAFQEGLRVGQIVAEAANFARDLGNRPANLLTPAALAALAEEMGRELDLKVTVLGPEEMEALGMGALLGVAQGSANPPRFLVLEHNPSREAAPTVLVGKGITFDSGGLSLKTSQGMEAMKFDMAGAAAVLGAMQAVARLGLPQRVVGIVPAVENMPGAGAQRPGDVRRALDGTTIEVINTDAEGRLILADALAYARLHLEPRPARMVDLATLTGACVVALGHHAAGLFTRNPDLEAGLRRAGERTGETVWPLPLFDVYRKQLESPVADLKNTGGRPAGAITAAKFLEHFAGDVPWAHIDIAGVAWVTEKPAKAYLGKGGTGFGVRLLVEWLMNL